MGTGRHRASDYVDMYLSDPVASSWYATNLQFNQIRDTYCVLVESRLALLLLAALLRALYLMLHYCVFLP